MNTIGMQSPSSYFLQSLPAAGPRSYCLPRIVLRSPSSSALSRPVRPLASLRWIDHRRLHDANEGNDSCSQQLVRTLLIDNYDSYTYNIYQELAVVNGVPPVVIFNDELTWEQICNYVYVENLFDNIVISPGPGSPTCPTDIGVCLQVLIHCKDIPILGVCLGHQSLGFACGAQIVQAPEPVHGRLSEIVHSGCSLFNGIPSGEKSGFKVMRYHSLVIAAESLPEELVPIAWTSSVRTLSLFDIKESDMSPGSFLNQTNKFQSIGDLSGDSEAAGLSDIGLLNDLERGKVIMGVMHSSRPHYGVQFHPESIATCYGRQIFQNFKLITIDHGLRTSLKETKVAYACQTPKETPNRTLFQGRAPMRKYLDFSIGPNLIPKIADFKYLKLKWKKMDCLANQVGGSKNIFCKLFGEENAQNTFWLDSSSTDEGRSRFSFMGGKGGSLWRQITYEISQQSVINSKAGGYVSIQDGHGYVETKFLEGGLLDFLDEVLKSFRYDKRTSKACPLTFAVVLLVSWEDKFHSPSKQASGESFKGKVCAYVALLPERFLRLDRHGILEAKPIKGTIARGRTPEEDDCLRLQLQFSEKDQAENLMIVDLLRNDLGRHNSGRKKSSTNPVECIKAAFPGGSMTGAPKLRSMEILDSIESSSRSIYSGSIGFISYNQTFDLNIVIRTVVIHKGEASIGAGGAIVALSNPEDEYQEMMLKAKAPTQAVLMHTKDAEIAVHQ
ncbi:hypothetical protein HPP92_010199 [Vanilla planifolia]|uniref:aminodeoxychorismate synthase n=1 Tax=Vanilla planifolia TaxID=51239 RepID=A0A835R5Z8_VANPL|nr:hypothetical protein HPP92_010199 [Vanilla planifolia]